MVFPEIKVTSWNPQIVKGLKLKRSCPWPSGGYAKNKATVKCAFTGLVDCDEETRKLNRVIGPTWFVSCVSRLRSFRII